MPVIMQDGVVNYTNRKVEGVDYIMAKLTEHSYFNNFLIDSVADKIHNHKAKIAWVGDYANEPGDLDCTTADVDYEKCWGDKCLDRNEVHQALKLCKRFAYRNRYLVNHDKGVYISFNDYRKNAKGKKWVMSPISLLTAIGNQRGGGDYYGLNEDKVGSWAWDEISIEDKKPYGYTQLNIFFKPNWDEE